MYQQIAAQANEQVVKADRTGINFIMFPVNSWAFWYSGVILGRACVPHLIRPPREKHSCAPSIANDFLAAVTPHVHMLFPPSNPSDSGCLERCSNCPINTPYVNCIMPRKQEEKTSNRHNRPLLLLPRIICHRINTDDDTGWQQSGWYHLSSGATKGGSIYDMWRATLAISPTIPQLNGGKSELRDLWGIPLFIQKAV